MKVQSTNETYFKPNFGAKIKFSKNVNLEELVDTEYYEFANSLLNQFEAYHPSETIIIGKTKDEFGESAIYAKNNKTKGRMRESFVDKSLGSYGNIPAFYRLLMKLLDQHIWSHNDFWPTDKNGRPEEMPKTITGSKEVSPQQHSVFVK